MEYLVMFLSKPFICHTIHVWYIEVGDPLTTPLPRVSASTKVPCQLRSDDDDDDDDDD